MFVTYQLDKARNLRYGMKALSIIEGAFGTNIARIDLNNLTMQQTAIIIQAGLAHEDPGLTTDKVMDLIDEHSSIMEAVEKMSEAFGKAFGTGNSEKK